MSKKMIIEIVVIIIIASLCIGGYYLFNNSNKKENDNNIKNDNNDNIINDSEKTNKILVVYYSAQGHTKNVAKKIAENLNADIFELEPKVIYTSEDLDWTDNNSRVSKEHNDVLLRNVELVKTNMDNWDDYDTILIGYPIWWGIAAWPVNNFVKDNDFTGKTVIPFCTSASSSLGNSDKLLKDLTKTGNWMEGHRFNSSATDSDIKSFTDSVK